jgi:lipoate-protein ligase A
VAGSALCRKGGAILQHGSILLHSSEDRLASLLCGRRAGDNGSEAGGQPDHAIGLCEVLGREVDYAEAALALREGMSEALATSFQEEPLREEELERAGELARERYGNLAWTLVR